MMLDGKLMGGKDRDFAFEFIEFWKMTPQMTTERAVEIFRVNPNVEVAVAVSSWDTKAWMAISGASKRRP